MTEEHQNRMNSHESSKLLSLTSHLKVVSVRDGPDVSGKLVNSRVNVVLQPMSSTCVSFYSNLY